jgi:nicotinate dehydrogenase subunit A
MATTRTLSVNSQMVTVTIDDPDMPLLYALQNNLGFHGPRFGCGLGQCGACTIHIDGNATRSCITPLSGLAEQNAIVTLEGLGSVVNPHPVQRAFIEEQAAQCGYCINGMIMELAAFLEQKILLKRRSKAHSRTTSAGAARIRASSRPSSGLRWTHEDEPMNDQPAISRRRLLQGGGAVVILFALVPTFVGT